MPEYNFIPDYAAWWKKKNLSKEQLIWLSLGICPNDIKKQKSILDKSQNSLTDSAWLGNFRHYLESLPKGMWIFDAHKWYMKYINIGTTRESFISALYDFAHEFPKHFHVFLLSVDKKIIPNKYDHYLDSNQYKIQSKSFKNIHDEISAFSFLIGVDGDGFSRFSRIEDEIEQKKLNFGDLLPDDKHFLKAYENFFEKEIGGDFVYKTYYSIWKSLRGNYWHGNFVEYVNLLHNNGYVFSDKVYAELKLNGINVVYEEDGWAINFYRKWIERGVWTLKEAATLYLGSDPLGGREFSGLNVFIPRKRGYKLFNSEMVMYIDNKGQWDSPPIGKYQAETSLVEFIQKHILAGNVIEAGKNREGESYFLPLAITKFFKEYCPNTYQSKALFQALGLNDNEGVVISGTAKTHTGMAGRPTAKHLILEELSKKINQGDLEDKISYEAVKLRKWLVSNHSDVSPPTKRAIENQIRSEYNKAKCIK